MNKIEGTVIEAGNIALDADNTVTGVLIAANREELHLWDGPLYGRRVVLLDKADHDAREDEIARLKRDNIAAHASAVQTVHDLSRRYCQLNN